MATNRFTLTELDQYLVHRKKQVNKALKTIKQIEDHPMEEKIMTTPQFHGISSDIDTHKEYAIKSLKGMSRSYDGFRHMLRQMEQRQRNMNRPPPPKVGGGRCSATTRSGARCRNKCSARRKYCHQH